MLRLLSATLLTMLTLAVGRAPAQGRPPLAELDGTWTATKMEASGRSLLPAKEVWQFTVKDGIVTPAARGKQAPGRPVAVAKVLDPEGQSKRITYCLEGNLVFYGIWEVRGDELWVCGEGVDTATEKDPEAQRPAKFDSNLGVLLVFKRVKK